MTHTPGPWKHITTVGPTKALIVEADGSTVVEVINRTWDSHFAANARLIASAPTLLDAAKVALDFIHTLPYSPSISLATKAQDALHDAIAKATGQ